MSQEAADRSVEWNFERHAETMSASPTMAFSMSSSLQKFQLVVLLVERQPCPSNGSTPSLSTEATPSM